MKKIIITLSLLFCIVYCNAQQQKREENERDTISIYGQLYTVKKSIGEYKVLKSSDIEPLNPRNYGPDDVRDVTEKMPSFPGGMAALMQYLQNNVNYPPQAAKENIGGRVVASFIVEKDGSLTDVRIAKSAHPLLDAEATRVISSMPNWNSGLDKNGTPVRVKYTLPVTFRLKDANSEQPVSNDTLSMPVIRYGVATIKGHLYDFSKEILKNVVLRRSLSVIDTLHATISDDGDFEFRFPVTHTQPVIIGYDGGYFMMCYVSPDDTTQVRIDINAIQKPALKRDENYVKVVEGPLARLANEYNHTQYSKSYADMRKKALGRYYNHPDLIGSNPKELFPKVIKMGARDRSKVSPALQELMRLNDQLTLLVVYQSELTNTPSYINKRGVAARTLYNKRRKRWAAEIEDSKNEAFLDILTSPKLLLCPDFMDFVHFFKNVPMDYPKYVDDELKKYVTNKK